MYIRVVCAKFRNYPLLWLVSDHGNRRKTSLPSSSAPLDLTGPRTTRFLFILRLSKANASSWQLDAAHGEKCGTVVRRFFSLLPKMPGWSLLGRKRVCIATRQQIRNTDDREPPPPSQSSLVIVACCLVGWALGRSVSWPRSILWTLMHLTSMTPSRLNALRQTETTNYGSVRGAEARKRD